MKYYIAHILRALDNTGFHILTEQKGGFGSMMQEKPFHGERMAWRIEFSAISVQEQTLGTLLCNSDEA